MMLLSIIVKCWRYNWLLRYTHCL